MALLDLLKKRRSVRAYKPDAVEPEKLEKVLEAARLAPTACNRQAFRLFVLETAGHEAELRRIYDKDWFVQPPVVLGIVRAADENWVRRCDGRVYGDVDAGIVFDHVTLEACELGLGTCWIGNFDPKAAVSLLGLKEGFEPIAFMPLGYPADEPRKKVRRPLDELVVYPFEGKGKN